jgi:factor associated with neutral sphingomyelinase activation
MYMSHYSTPGIVLYFLIRQVPQYILTVQNDGYGGPPDRIFHDLGLSWAGGCLKVLADNKELIPDGAELGRNHLDLKVEDVTLPPWATNH